MVIIQVLGGLGNQMFQYAAGLALSIRCGHSLRLDVAGFDSYGLHQGFELQRVFDCPVDIAGKSEVRKILGWQYSSAIRRIVARPAMARIRREGFIVEPHFHYWQGINDVQGDCYLAGYWQSERYFRHLAATIRADFTFTAPLANRNAELADRIGQVGSVSIHVRRGDYAHHPRTAATHGLCSLDYYDAAIRHISDRVEKPHFFVFSDDMDWVKRYLRIGAPCLYVDHNQGAESYRDMHLMSLCRHHVIANSSFSWWGAWLNPNPDKMVVAPKKWFANDNDIKDLFPKGWVAL